MPESTSSSIGIRQVVSEDKFCADYALKHQLGDAIPSMHDEIFLAEIGQDHLHFSAVIGVDGPWAIQDSDTVLQGEPASRTDLTLISDRDLQLHTDGNGNSLSRLNYYILVHSSTEIDP